MQLLDLFFWWLAIFSPIFFSLEENMQKTLHWAESIGRLLENKFAKLYK